MFSLIITVVASLGTIPERRLIGGTGAWSGALGIWLPCVSTTRDLH